MKSHLLTSIVLLFACAGLNSASAQQPANQLLTRHQVAGLAANSTPRGDFPDLPLRSRSAEQGASESSNSSPTSKINGSLITLCSSLAVVLGLFAGLVWISRKFGSGGGNSGALPKEVFQALGSAAMDSRNRITMIRCGNRILVLSQNSQGIQPISEITSPEEVRELTAACLGDSKKAFVATLQSIEQERAHRGFVAGQPEVPTPRSRGRLFASA